MIIFKQEGIIEAVSIFIETEPDEYREGCTRYIFYANTANGSRYFITVAGGIDDAWAQYILKYMRTCVMKGEPIDLTDSNIRHLGEQFDETLEQ